MFHNNLDNKKEIISNNYMVLYYPDHPNSHTKGYMYYHRLVMENYLDRYLDNDEHVHHLDNNPLNNDIENLELVNHISHAKLHQRLNGKQTIQTIQEKSCKQCNKQFKPSHNDIQFCSTTCFDFYRRKVARPTKEKLHKLIWSIPTTDIAKYYNVSDKTIAKWCKSYVINKPPRGYWTKVYSGKIQPSIPTIN